MKPSLPGSHELHLEVDSFGNESHGWLPAIFCRALAYRYSCIFKGCHVKRQARPLNTFKFINGEGYTPALCNTSHGENTHRACMCVCACTRYIRQLREIQHDERYASLRDAFLCSRSCKKSVPFFSVSATAHPIVRQHAAHR